MELDLNFLLNLLLLHNLSNGREEIPHSIPVFHIWLDRLLQKTRQ